MILFEMWYVIKHSLQKDLNVCPKCGSKGFQHGFPHDERYYCNNCLLWKPKEATKSGKAQ